jgi:hypothetical protein
MTTIQGVIIITGIICATLIALALIGRNDK